MLPCLLPPVFALASSFPSGRFLPRCGKDDFSRRQHLLCSDFPSRFLSIGDSIDLISSAPSLSWPKAIGKSRDSDLARSSISNRNGLNQIEAEINEGKFPFRIELEDRAHEHRGGSDRTHWPGRSKAAYRTEQNDQVTLDLRLYLRHESDLVDVRAREFSEPWWNWPRKILPPFCRATRSPAGAAGSFLRTICWLM